MRDYWLSKLFFDLQSPALAQQFRADPQAVLKSYPMEERVKRAVLEHDAPFLAERTNAYLLRYYFFTIGMKDAEFVQRLNG
ncbi:MAG TPA: hypothetical protein VFK84_14200 [Burkholderiales bacterium]|nr:hypothetical protein [Burkholderiales bacterium]